MSISAHQDAIIDGCKRVIKNGYASKTGEHLLSAEGLIVIVQRMQPADVKPVVRGRWIMRGGKRYCSVCGDRACVTRDTDDFWYTVGTKYCPNCGAEMSDLVQEGGK